MSLKNLYRFTSLDRNRIPILTVPEAPVLHSLIPVVEGLVAHITPQPDGGSPILTYKYQLDGGSFIDAGTADTEFTIANLDVEEYTVRVIAVNVIGESTPSNPLSATPLPVVTVPEAPTIHSIVSGDQELTVHFTLGGDGGAAITDVEYRLDGGSTGSFGSANSPQDITGLTNNQEYDVQICAVNAEGNSSWSNTMSGIPLSATWPVYTDPGGAITFQTIKRRSMSDCAVQGIQCTGTGNPPSANRNDWTCLPDDFLIPSEHWGTRAQCGGFFKVPNGIGMPFSSAVGGGHTGLKANGNIENWFADGQNWMWDLNYYPAWSGRRRKQPHDMVYDPSADEYVIWYNDARAAGFPDGTDNRHYFGMRCAGLAWSSDFVNWNFRTQGPSITMEDIYDLWPGLLTDPKTNYEQWGRLYVRGAHYYNGYYYLMIHGSVRVSSGGGNDQDGAFMVKSQNRTGPWEAVDYRTPDNNDSPIIPEHNIVEYDGKFYTARAWYHPTRGARIGVANNIEGPYNLISTDSLFDTGYGSNHGHGHTMLGLWNNIWFICQTVYGPDVESQYGSNARIMKCAYYDPFNNL